MRFLASLGAMVLIAASTPSRAHERTDKAREIRAIHEPAPPASKIDPERQRQIYQILQGGAPVLDEYLDRHLWRVAGSLAGRDWSPPSVKIEVVVRDIGRR